MTDQIRSGGDGAGHSGVHLVREDLPVEPLEALVRSAGGRVPLSALLDDLPCLATASRRGRLAGRAVRRALAFTRHDQRDPVWWPQGVTTSADADPSGTVAGRRLVVTTWYAKALDDVHRGARLTFLDLATRRYRHVLLVEPTREPDGRLGWRPVRVHAGGVVWAGPWFHVAATGKGFVSAHVDDLLRVPTTPGGPELAGSSTFGHGYVLPVRTVHRARTDEGHTPLRYSFLSLDRSPQPPRLLVGEYGRGTQTTRWGQLPLDPTTWLPSTDSSGVAHPVLAETRRKGMQGLAVARGRPHVTTSAGPWKPGTLWTGGPDRMRAHRMALPMGPEDLSYWPQTDTLWSVTEHPGRRWVLEMRRSWFD